MANHPERVLKVSSTPQQAVDQIASLVNAVKDYAIFMLDPSGRVITWNTGARRIKGYSADEILGRHFSIFYPPEDVAAGKPERLLGEARRKGRVEDENWRVRKDGSRFWADVVITALYDESGEFSGFGKVTRDLTERHRVDEQFRLLVQGVTDYAIFMLDPSGHVATWNAGAERAKGYSADEILGKHFSVFYPPEDIAAGKPWWLLEQARREGKVEDEDWRVRKDGSRFWANVVITALYDERNELRGFAKVTRDLTERREAEERQRAQEIIARQNEVRRQEIHHRVKNNLQVISSLLTLQSMRLPDPNLAQVFQEMQDRIRAMAVIHEKLYQSAEGMVDFGEYLEDLVSTIAEGARPEKRGIKLVLEAEPMMLSMESAIPCCLIVNELLTNALKHAFPEGRSGNVEVRMMGLDGNRALLAVSDDGVGFPADARLGRESNGLGFRILDALTQQLEGTYRMVPGATGTAIEVKFPISGSAG